MKILLWCLLSTLIFVNPTQARDIGPAKIVRVYTDLTNKSGWWLVPKGVHKMTIYVDAENTETVLFWLVPTGTQTWGQRELIGYDKDGSDGWSLTWEFGNRQLHDHIHIQALGSDSVSQSNEIINIGSDYP